MKKILENVVNDRDRALRKLPGWDQDQVRKSRFLVVGAGALGNEVLKNLALLNVGQVVIVDFDHIETSNLSRSVLFREEDCQGKKRKAAVASQRLQELNPNVKVQFLHGDVATDLGWGIIRRMDAVIGCLDNRLARLYLNRQTHRMGKTWINGGILNLAGQVNVYTPERSCYECELTQQDWKGIQTRLGCTDIARRNSIMGQIATSPISASIIGALQVQEAMKVVFDQPENSFQGKRFYFDGQYNVFRTFTARQLKPECQSHFQLPAPIEAKELTASHSLKETLAWLADYFGVENPVIELGHGLLTGIANRKSKKSFELVIPKAHFSDYIANHFREGAGEEIGFPPENLYSRLDHRFPYAELPLKRLGIPPLHILKVRLGRKTEYVELTGDQRILEHSGEIKLPDWNSLVG